MITPPSQRIGIVTCDAEKLADYYPTAAEPDFVPTEPPFTPDDQLLVDELRRRGHQVSAVVWGVDTARLIDRFDRVIIRSAWDYMDSDELRQGFLRWLEKLAATGLVVENEPPVMLWLMDKRYLLDFAAVGVPIVPTRLIPLGESFDLETFVERHVAAVIKPAVSAAGAGLEFLPDRQAARTFQQEFADRFQRGAQLVQPFLPEIQTNGEWSLVYFGGEYNHGVHKLPARGRIMVHAERGGSLRFAEPPSVVRQLGDRAAAAVPRAFAQRGGGSCRMPLYLRIDVIETATGGLVSECEGVEPELFFRARPGSAAIFAELIESRSILDRKAQLPYKACLGAGLFLFAAAALQQIGLQYTSSANSGFITGFYILFVPVLGMFLGHKVPKILWAGVLVCLVGFYLLSVTGDFVVSKGDWLTLICAVLWAFQILVIDHVAGKGDPFRIACLQFAVCAVLSMLSGLRFEHCTFDQIKAASGAIAYTGFMSVGVAYTLQVVCQKHCPPAPAAVIMSLEAVFAAIAGYLVLHQTLTARALLGCFLILSGVLMVQLVPMMRRKTA